MNQIPGRELKHFEIAGKRGRIAKVSNGKITVHGQAQRFGLDIVQRHRFVGQVDPYPTVECKVRNVVLGHGFRQQLTQDFRQVNRRRHFETNITGQPGFAGDVLPGQDEYRSCAQRFHD